MEINHLPIEMLIQVFQKLPLQDLKMAVLVSRKWRSIGEDPSLWKSFLFLVHSRDDLNNLSIPRLRDIQEIYISRGNNWQHDDWEAIFQASIRLHGLKIIDGLHSFDLSSVEPGLFARAVTRLEDVNLCDTAITDDQKQALFEAMSQNCKIKKLDLSGNNLSSVEPGLFSRAVTSLVNVNLSYTKITNYQKHMFFTAMTQNCQLKTLGLSCNNLCSVEPRLFARALTGLVDVNLCNTHITDEQKQALFTAMSPNCKLKTLDISENNMSSVESEMFANAVSRLVDVNLCLTNITLDQVQALFIAMSKNFQLKKLDLCCNNLSSVAPGLFVKAITRLEDVSLHGTNLTDNQYQALFSAISQNVQMKNLDLYCNNLSSVEPDILATAITRLEDVDLQVTELSTEQLTKILELLQEDTKLKKLLLQGNNFAGVDLGIIRNASERLGYGLQLDIDQGLA